MFGEYESESPRVPSPWDSLISSPRSLSPSKSGSHSNGNLAPDAISTSISPQHLSPSPLLLPRLVPENDSGNVEYKLQLLNPSPARFARLVTQLKWRLLEGGGQAYYELGVADSGDLVGLGRDELESSLDTLEMMAGEIGASVIVVKEIEVPPELAARYEEDARNGGQLKTWGDARGKRSRRREKGLIMSYLDDEDSAAASTVSLSSVTNTETEEATDDGDCDDMRITVILQRPTAPDHTVSDIADSMAVFSMDSELESDAAEGADVSEIDEDKLVLSPPQYAIDLEISSVYKPRPMRKRFHHTQPGHQHRQKGQGRSVGKGGKKGPGQEKHHNHHTQKDSSNDSTSARTNKALTRRQARDRRREERKQNLLALAARGVVEAANANSIPTNGADHTSRSISTEPVEDVRAEADTLVEKLEALHVDVGQSVSLPRVPESILSTSVTSTTTDSTNTTVAISVNTNTTTIEDAVPHAGVDGDNVDDHGIDHGDDDDDDGEVFCTPAVPPSVSGLAEDGGGKPDMKLIVEVLVVRKMSMEEGFLDFEGFSFV